MGVIAPYRRVLTNGALARLLFGEFVSSIGDWLYLVALIVLVWEQTEDPVTLGIVGAARIVPYILLSVPAGIVADRYDRRLVLLVTDVIRGVIMVVIAGAVIVGAPVLVIVALSILATCFSAFFSPAIGAYLPSLVRDESELGPANSAWSSLDNLAFFIGPAFAALLLSIGSLPVAFLINAGTFGIVALVLLRLPSRRSAPEAGAQAEAPTKPVAAKSTLRSIFRPLLGLSVLNVVCDFVFGGLGVITVLLAVDVFHMDEGTGTGLLNSAIGVGGIVGALVAGALVLRRRLATPLVIGAGGLVIGLVALSQAPSDAFSLALVAMALTAAGALLIEIVATTLLQRIVPDAIRGRTIGTMETVSVTAYASGSFLIPVLAAQQPGLVLAGSAVAIAIAAAVSTVLLGQHALEAPAADDVRRRLALVPMFAGLQPARLETAMRRATIRPMTQGEVVIRQGDEADYFYVIAEGTVEVTQSATDGAPGTQTVLRQMGVDEFFGEIGLLSRVPRTATVTATTDGKLIALDRKAFLELVESGPGLTHRLLDIHRGGITTGAEPSAVGSVAQG